jgi:nitrite reductase/ring-hydroxylating ferredoxin subunit
MLRVLLDAEEWEVAITRVNDKIYAFRDVCPHQAFPLSVGQVHGCQVVCAGHNWSFDVTTGAAISPPIRKKLETYPVKIEAGDVWVKVHIW